MKQHTILQRTARSAAFWSLIFFACFASALAQTNTFTYQGRLTDSAANGSGSYLMEFRLFAQSAGGTAIDTLTDVPVTVSGNVFTVQLNFTAANAFNGGERFLEIAVKRNAGESYTTLAPRQPITSAPYAIRAKTADVSETANNSLAIGGTAANQIIKEGDQRLSDSRTPAPGSGNYIQNQNAADQSSTNFRIDGTGAANILSAQTQFNLGGSRILVAPGTDNLFAGISAGGSNTSGRYNSFFGARAGALNTNGDSNSFFGGSAGQANTTGGSNSFFGTDAGANTMTGSNNSFFGARAGRFNTTGVENSFVGADAGNANTT
ncbi:MAG TPA: hypothetical protein VK308_08340, partial [Pyrinomonadaceae bacterium]|nr:hypothetical protein [Pyrinomonadaceae bacterium]